MLEQEHVDEIWEEVAGKVGSLDQVSLSNECLDDLRENSDEEILKDLAELDPHIEEDSIHGSRVLFVQHESATCKDIIVIDQ